MNLFLYLLTYFLFIIGIVFSLLGVMAHSYLLLIIGIACAIIALLIDIYNKIDNSNYY